MLDTPDCYCTLAKIRALLDTLADQATNLELRLRILRIGAALEAYIATRNANFSDSQALTLRSGEVDQSVAAAWATALYAAAGCTVLSVSCRQQVVRVSRFEEDLRYVCAVSSSNCAPCRRPVYNHPDGEGGVEQREDQSDCWCEGDFYTPYYFFPGSQVIGFQTRESLCRLDSTPAPAPSPAPGGMR